VEGAKEGETDGWMEGVIYKEAQFWCIGLYYDVGFSKRDIWRKEERNGKKITFSGKDLRSALSFACAFILLAGHAGQGLTRYARPRGIGNAVCKSSMRN